MEYLKEQIGSRVHTFYYGKNTIQMKVSDYIDTALELFGNPNHNDNNSTSNNASNGDSNQQQAVADTSTNTSSENYNNNNKSTDDNEKNNDSNSNNNSKRSYPKLPTDTEKLPYIRHFSLRKYSPFYPSSYSPSSFSSYSLPNIHNICHRLGIIIHSIQITGRCRH